MRGSSSLKTSALELVCTKANINSRSLTVGRALRPTENEKTRRSRSHLKDVGVVPEVKQLKIELVFQRPRLKEFNSGLHDGPR